MSARTEAACVVKATFLLYPAAIAVAETFMLFGGPVAGVLCYAVLILYLQINHWLWNRPARGLRSKPNDPYWYSHDLPSLTLIPLLRIVSMAVPVSVIPEQYWYAVIGAPILASAWLAGRIANVIGSDWRLGQQFTPCQLLIAVSGLPIGLAGFVILRPRPLIDTFDWRALAAHSVLLMIFLGFTEELVFRAVLQRIAYEVLGRHAILWSSVLFAISYIGFKAPYYVLFIGLVGLFFGWCSSHTGSIVGVTTAHGLASIGMLLIWPLLLH